MNPSLESRFKQTWFIQNKNPPPNMFINLEKRYSKAGRSYHTMEHIEECFLAYDSLDLEADIFRELALWFHDIVYDPMSKTNEASSVSLMDQLLSPWGFSAMDISRIGQLIMATKHEHITLDPDRQIVVDCDLWIFNASKERFDLYEKQIREEYRDVPAHIYFVERIKVLEYFLKRPTIYQYCGCPFSEDKAIKNLRRSIESLTKEWNQLKDPFIVSPP